MSAAEVLAQHESENSGFACSGCHWTPKAHYVTDAEEFAAHHLDVLKAAGYAVVELPARRDSGWVVDAEDDDFHVTSVSMIDTKTGAGLTGSRIFWGAIELNLSPTHTAALAAALLAADAAERAS